MGGIVLSILLTIFLWVGIICIEKIQTIFENITNVPVSAEVEEREDCVNIYLSVVRSEDGPAAYTYSIDNMILSLNRRTKQILLIEIPDNTCVDVFSTPGQKDLIGYTGLSGIDISVAAAETLCGVSLDGYLRINLEGLADMVDALGGITVDSAKSFENSDFSFQKGFNDLNGEQTLVFLHGDPELVKHGIKQKKVQQAVLDGLLNKLMSPSLIIEFDAVSASLAECFSTNLPQIFLKNLFCQEIEDGIAWSVFSHDLEGRIEDIYSSSTGQEEKALILNQEALDQARKYIQQINKNRVIQ